MERITATYNLKPISLAVVLTYKDRMKKEGILFSDKAEYFCLYVNDQAVGFYGVKWAGRSATFKCDWTMPNNRRQGHLYMATILRLARCKERGVKTVYANCTPMAFGTHRKLGAKIVKRYKNGVVRVKYEL